MRPYIFLIGSAAMAMPIQTQHTAATRDTTTVTGLLEGIYESMTDADGHVLLDRREIYIAAAIESYCSQFADPDTIRACEQSVIKKRHAMPDDQPTTLECDFPITPEELRQCEQLSRRDVPEDCSTVPIADRSFCVLHNELNARNAMSESEAEALDCDFPVTVEGIQQCEQFKG